MSHDCCCEASDTRDSRVIFLAFITRYSCRLRKCEFFPLAGRGSRRSRSLRSSDAQYFEVVYRTRYVNDKVSHDEFR